MRKILLVLILLLLFPTAVRAQVPTEYWVPFEMRKYRNGQWQKINAEFWDTGIIIYYGHLRDNKPYIPPSTRRHERTHYWEAQEYLGGITSWFRQYRSNPAFSCAAERRAGTYNHYRCQR